jgi:hypothetical protein
MASLAVLRLELCGNELVRFPMGDKHFHFLRNAGMYHFLLEDLPHGVVSVALLMMAKGGESAAHTSMIGLHFVPIHSQLIARSVCR